MCSVGGDLIVGIGLKSGRGSVLNGRGLNSGWSPGVLEVGVAEFDEWEGP